MQPLKNISMIARQYRKRGLTSLSARKFKKGNISMIFNGGYSLIESAKPQTQLLENVILKK